MKNIIILGASGNIAKHVIDILVKKDDIRSRGRRRCRDDKYIITNRPIVVLIF